MSTIFRDPVRVGDLAFNTNVPDEHGVQYFCDLMTGWDDTADPTVVIATFTYNDGAVAGDRFPLKEQYFDMGGYLRAPSQLALEQAKDELRRNLNPNFDLKLVREGPIPKAADVRTSTGIEFPQTIRSRNTGDNACRFLVQFMAPWPFKESPNAKEAEASAYSPGTYYRTYPTEYFESAGRHVRVYTSSEGTEQNTSTLPDSITISNDGTADGYPFIEVQGPLELGSWAVVNETTQERITFDIELSASSVLMIDNKAKIAEVIGQPVDYFLRGNWIRLVPGVNIIRLVTADVNPEARLRIRAYDTYR